MKPILLALPFSLALAAYPVLAAGVAAPLPGLGADLSQVSVSGLSSGAFMAAQIATAYSATFKGVGVIAGGPYDCASTHPGQSPLVTAATVCMQPTSPAEVPDGAASWRSAQRRAQEGSIDPVANLARQRVYLFSGTADPVVKTVVVNQVEKYYQLAGVAPAAIRYAKDVQAGHAIVTARTGDSPCGDTRAPYMNNCGFSQAAELLRHLAGSGAKPAATGELTGRIIEFDQREFVRGRRSSMDDSAYAYVPAACREQSCAVHVVFHGCLQGASEVGERFYRHAGYNEFADANAMIVLYPQVMASKGVPANPKGCWDFWGYSSEHPAMPDFQTRQAPQMAAVMAMLRRLGEARAAAQAR